METLESEQLATDLELALDGESSSDEEVARVADNTRKREEVE